MCDSARPCWERRTVLACCPGRSPSSPPGLRDRAISAVLELPDDIALISLRELAPDIGRLRRRHSLNILATEALAAAIRLEAEVILSAPSPRLQSALEDEQRSYRLLK